MRNNISHLRYIQLRVLDPKLEHIWQASFYQTFAFEDILHRIPFPHACLPYVLLCPCIDHEYVQRTTLIFLCFVNSSPKQVLTVVQAPEGMVH